MNASLRGLGFVLDVSYTVAWAQLRYIRIITAVAPVVIDFWYTFLNCSNAHDYIFFCKLHVHYYRPYAC